MMSYYLERGHTLEELCNLSKYEKAFYMASCLYNLELKAKMFEGLKRE